MRSTLIRRKPSSERFGPPSPGGRRVDRNEPAPGDPSCVKPSSSPPRARRSARPIAARSTTRRPRRWAAMSSPARSSAPRSRAARSTTSSWARRCSRDRRASTSPAKSPLRAGLPTSVAGMSVDRQCASGLMAIAIAAKEIVDDGMSITVGGGLESISLVQNDKMNRYRAPGPLARRASRRHLHDDDRDGRNRR